MKKIFIYISLAAMFFSGLCSCEQNLKPTEPATPLPAKTEGDGGYLWLFMTNANYRQMFYAISRDCFDWVTLNLGKPVNTEYSGHHSLTQGRDGAWYQIGVEKYNEGKLTLWRTEDFITWTTTYFDRKALTLDGWTTDAPASGAPKPYYDADSDQYIICWHMGQPYSDMKTRRTLYCLTKDFVTFSEPKPLFQFSGEYADLYMIDTFIKKINGKYYAITKIEDTKEDCEELAKSICYCTSDNLTGPYSNPTRITPLDKQREAPILVDAPDGKFYLFAESFAAMPYAYDLFVANSIDGNWAEHSFMGPNVDDGTSRPGARHGWIVPVSENVYQGLVNKYYYIKNHANVTLGINSVEGLEKSSIWKSEEPTMQFVEILDGSAIGNNLTSNSVTVTKDKTKAVFPFTTNYKNTPSQKYDYYFISPSALFVGVDENVKTVNVMFPSRQKPLADAADPDAIVLGVADLGNTAIKDTFDGNLNHLSSFTKISFKDCALTGVTSIKMGIEGKSLAGIFGYPFTGFNDPVAKEVTDVISFDISNIAMGKNFDINVVTVPFKVAAGDKIHFTIQVGKIYYGLDYTFDSAMEFAAGKQQSIIVDASKAEKEDVSIKFNGVAVAAIDDAGDRYYKNEGYLTTGKVSLKQGQTVTVTGLSDIDEIVPKEWLEPTGISGNYKFRAVDGDYVMFFNPDTYFIAFENFDRAAAYPVNLWLNGKVDCNAHVQYKYMSGSFPCFPGNMAFSNPTDGHLDPAYYICLAPIARYDIDGDGQDDSGLFEGNFYCFAASDWILRFRLRFNNTGQQLNMNGYTLTVDDNQAEFSDKKNPSEATNPSLRRENVNWKKYPEKAYNIVMDTNAKTIKLSRIF